MLLKFLHKTLRNAVQYVYEPSRYMVKVDSSVIHMGTSLKKATCMYELEVEFNNIFRLPYRHTICLLERCADGHGWEYLRVTQYDEKVKDYG